jgi:hypothetical protein
MKEEIGLDLAKTWVMERSNKDDMKYGDKYHHGHVQDV